MNAKNASGKTAEPSTQKKAHKTHAKGPPSYERHIYKILKTVHPKMRMSKQAMAIMNSQVNDTFERLSAEALKLSRVNKGQTLSVRDITSACRLVLPGELSKHAVAEGSRCLLKYKKIIGDRSGGFKNKSAGHKTDMTEKSGIDSPEEKGQSPQEKGI